MLNHSDSNFLPPIQENDFLPPIGRWATFGGLFIVCVTGLAIPVASVAKYKETVKAKAIVRPVGELRIVQSATEGEVTQVLVKKNQAIKQGDVIATIDDSKLQTKKSQLQTSIQQAHLQLVRVNAQISAVNRQLKAETDRNNRSIISAQAELSRRRRDYQDKQKTTIAELKEAEANFRSTVAALNVARSKRDRYEPIAEIGALPKNQLEEAQLEVQQQQQAVEANRARVQRALAALDPSNAEVAIASEQIAQAKATAEASKATSDKDRAIVRQSDSKQEQTLKCLTPINLQKRFISVTDAQFSLCLTAAMTLHALTPDTNVWAVARSVKQQLNPAMETEQVMTAIQQLQAWMSENPSATEVWQGFIEQYGCDIVVTNLGRLAILQQFGQLHLRGIYGPSVMPSRDDGRLLGVATVGERLCFTLSYPESILSPEAATQLQQEAMQLLDTAIASTSTV
jgi:multidrug efflux pump subunit AcrA (membrane-fusion protein)